MTVELLSSRYTRICPKCKSNYQRIETDTLHVLTQIRLGLFLREWGPIYIWTLFDINPVQPTVIFGKGHFRDSLKHVT